MWAMIPAVLGVIELYVVIVLLCVERGGRDGKGLDGRGGAALVVPVRWASMDAEAVGGEGAYNDAVSR